MEEALYDEVVRKLLQKEKVTWVWILSMEMAIFASEVRKNDDTSPDTFTALPH